MNFYRSVLCVSAILAAFSCSKDNKDGRSGHISFAVSNDGTVAELTRSNVSQYAVLPSGGDFTIAVVDAQASPVWNGRISEWDASTALAAGGYSVTANYGSNEEEGFGKPYFTGSASFTVTGGETASVSIPVSLGNTIVKVACTDMFKNYFTDYSFKITRDGSTVVEFPKNETRAAFVDGYKFNIEGTLTSQSGKVTSFSREYTNLDEKTCYTFTFDSDNVGGATLTVVFSDTVETVNLGEKELNE